MFSAKEEIDDVQTFLSLNQHDYTRLGLTTKMIKIIEKMQMQYKNSNETSKDVAEEWLDDVVDETRKPAEVCRRVTNGDNPYEGISLEQVVNLPV